jgi:hypothetical protein
MGLEVEQKGHMLRRNPNKTEGWDEMMVRWREKVTGNNISKREKKNGSQCSLMKAFQMVPFHCVDAR